MVVTNQDTIHTVNYAWAMQQVDPEELGEGALYPIWKLREMQQLGVQSLILPFGHHHLSPSFDGQCMVYFFFYL